MIEEIQNTYKVGCITINTFTKKKNCFFEKIREYLLIYFIQQCGRREQCPLIIKGESLLKNEENKQLEEEDEE